MTMLVQETLLHCKNMQEDEADETLSLSDLPLYGDPSVQDWEDLYPESQGSSSISSSEQDHFEFSSHGVGPSAATFPPENFIFCGKIIPYRKPDALENVSSKAVENKQTRIKKKRITWEVFGWKFGFGTSSTKQVQSKNGRKSTTLMHKKDDSSKKEYNSKQHGKGHAFPLHKMHMLTSTASGKARWYLYLFGNSRFSSEMELRDIKSRQSHHQGRHSPPPSPTITFLNHHNDKVIGGTNRGSSLWGLIRVLSCGGNDNRSTIVAHSTSNNRLE